MFKEIESHVHYRTVHSRQEIETTTVSISWWIDKENVLHAQNRILLGHKKNEILSLLTTWMKPEIII